jgi:DHA1 family tetracycline resistance protein-like MFS transporter
MRTEPLKTAGPRRGAIIFIFITVALDMIALGIIGPVFVPLVERLTGGDVGHATLYLGISGTLFALMQFLWSPFLGMLSDRFGRKPVIVLSNIGTAVDYGIMALAPNLGWLLAGRIFAGVTTANIVAASAYISDVTPPEKRAGAFGMIGAAFGLGFIIGPAIGGLLGGFGDRVPFWVAAGFSVANGIYGAFVVPESLPASLRTTTFNWLKANPIGALKTLRAHPELQRLSIVTFLSNIAGLAMPAVWVLYVTERYHWNSASIGFSLVALGVTSVASQALVIGRFVKRFGERAALFSGVAFGALGTLFFAFAVNGWIFIAGIVPLCLWGLTPAAAQAMMSRRAGPSEQGELQGALGSLRGLGSLIGPALFTGAFGLGIAMTPQFAGLPWIVSGVLLVVSILPALSESPLEATAE